MLTPASVRPVRPRPRPFAILVAIALTLAVAPAAQAAGRCGSHPWCEVSLSPDRRADLLLAELTVPEQIGLLGGDELVGVVGNANLHTGVSDGVPRLDLPDVNYSDGPVGPRQGPSTAPPIPMALAATFEPRLAAAYGGMVANEVKAKGNDVVYAPTVDIVRTPLAGRTFETFGEDPYLSSRLAVPWIEAAQDEGVIANIKHFATNNQEGASPTADTANPSQPIPLPSVDGSRFLLDARLSERALREIYLPMYDAAVHRADVGSVMCAYNRINGGYACENDHLLNDILKDEWGFDGFVLADYGAAHNAVDALPNGLDFEPWPGLAYKEPQVLAAIASDPANLARVSEHVHRILRTLFKYGFFDRAAFVNDDSQIDKRVHRRIARRVEVRALTLLRNRRRLLPLQRRGLDSIAVIGPDATEFKTGGGSANVTPFEFRSPLDAIRKRAGGGVEVSYDDGSDPGRATGLAGSADVAIVFASDYQTEFVDRSCLSLECPDIHGDQDGLIASVTAANPRTVVVLETGGPVLTPWRRQAGAILEAWYPGSAAGPAITRVLFGDAEPGGRLPVTFPRRESDLPTAGDPEAYPGVAQTATYKEGIFVGYRHYDEEGLKPAYEFGFGLGYTRFRFGDLRIRPATGGRVGARVSVGVRNIGPRAGVAKPQLYLGLPEGPKRPRQPPRQLRGIASIQLAAGHRGRVRFRLGRRAFSHWSSKFGGWHAARGCYRIEVGTSSRRIAVERRVTLRGRRCTPDSGRG